MSKRTGIMLCYPLEEKRLLNQIRGCHWTWPVLVQPKLDGERCRAKDGSQLLSSEGNSFNHCVPHLLQKYQEICVRVGFSPELDGELYNHGLTFEEIHSRVSTSRLTAHEDASTIKYHVFDLIDQYLSQTQRLQFLTLLKMENPLVLVPTYKANNLDHIKMYLEKFYSNGYEGIIIREQHNKYIRRRSNMILKFKPKKTDEYQIVGVQEELTLENHPKGILGSLLCEKDGQIFATGSGTLTNEQKKTLWKQKDDLVGKICRVWYQSITAEKKVPKFISKIKILEKSTEQSPINPFLDIN